MQRENRKVRLKQAVPGHLGRAVLQLCADTVLCPCASHVENSVLSWCRESCCPYWRPQHLPGQTAVPPSLHPVPRFVCDEVLRFWYVSFLQDMKLQTQTASPSLSPGCPKGFFGKQCRKKCNCANRGRCHRIYGACLCDPGRYGRHCHLGTPLLWVHAAFGLGAVTEGSLLPCPRPCSVPQVDVWPRLLRGMPLCAAQHAALRQAGRLLPLQAWLPRCAL